PSSGTRRLCQVSSSAGAMPGSTSSNDMPSSIDTGLDAAPTTPPGRAAMTATTRADLPRAGCARFARHRGSTGICPAKPPGSTRSSRRLPNQPLDDKISAEPRRTVQWGTPFRLTACYADGLWRGGLEREQPQDRPLARAAAPAYPVGTSTVDLAVSHRALHAAYRWQLQITVDHGETVVRHGAHPAYVAVTPPHRDQRGRPGRGDLAAGHAEAVGRIGEHALHRALELARDALDQIGRGVILGEILQYAGMADFHEGDGDLALRLTRLVDADRMVPAARAGQRHVGLHVETALVAVVDGGRTHLGPVPPITVGRRRRVAGEAAIEHQQRTARRRGVERRGHGGTAAAMIGLRQQGVGAERRRRGRSWPVGAGCGQRNAGQHEHAPGPATAASPAGHHESPTLAYGAASESTDAPPSRRASRLLPM